MVEPKQILMALLEIFVKNQGVIARHRLLLLLKNKQPN